MREVTKFLNLDSIIEQMEQPVPSVVINLTITAVMMVTNQQNCCKQNSQEFLLLENQIDIFLLHTGDLEEGPIYLKCICLSHCSFIKQDQIKMKLREWISSHNQLVLKRMSTHYEKYSLVTYLPLTGNNLFTIIHL